MLLNERERNCIDHRERSRKSDDRKREREEANRSSYDELLESNLREKMAMAAELADLGLGSAAIQRILNIQRSEVRGRLKNE